MKRSLTLLPAVLLIVGLATSGLAWEFSLKGEYENRFRWLGRTGDHDLFGNAATQDHPGGRSVGFAGPNTYNTGALPTVPMPTSNFLLNQGSAAGRQLLITRGGFSSRQSDAFYNESRFTLRPTFEVNGSISVRGVYNIGGYRNKYHQNTATGSEYLVVPPLERYYMSQSSMNAYDTAALVSVEQFWAKVGLPWGSLAMGVRSFPFGVGATFGQNTRSESFLLAVPFGPLRLLGAVWPARSRFYEAWATIPDSEGKSRPFVALGLTGAKTNVSMGAIAIFRHFPGSSLISSAKDAEDNTWAGLLYLKYFNGRFLANAEYAQIKIDSNRPGDPQLLEALGTLAETLHMEGRHFFSELGIVLGPWKMSVVGALASGPVLSDGSRLRNVPAGGFYQGQSTPAPFSPGNNPYVHVAFPINYQALEPYEYLMFNTYAGGNNGGWNALDFGFVTDEHGMMTDAYCLAGRLDLAVASNLNVWGSYIWAHRLERNGTYFGQYQSSGSLASGSIPNLRAFYNAAGRSWGTGNDYVSDGFIGWEMNFGLDWKLLEGLTFKGRGSYWQPGNYFKEAFQSVVFDEDGTVTTRGVLRQRHPIVAFQGSFLIEF